MSFINKFQLIIVRLCLWTFNWAEFVAHLPLLWKWEDDNVKRGLSDLKMAVWCKGSMLGRNRLLPVLVRQRLRPV